MFKEILLFNSKVNLYTGPHVEDLVHSSKNKIFVDGLIKGLTGMVKCRGGRCRLTGSKGHKNGRKPLQ